MSPAIIIMNTAYLITLVSLTVRNILVLRMLMTCAQLILVSVGLFTANYTMAFWNAVFSLINLVQVIILLKEKKPIRVPEGLQDLYRERFNRMSGREFMTFWKRGESAVLNGSVITAGKFNDYVYLILEGNASVKTGGKILAVLGRGDFMGEMSYISGMPPTASVDADNPVSVRQWNKSYLENLRIRNNDLWQKIHQSLGHDIVLKVGKLRDRLN